MAHTATPRSPSPPSGRRQTGLWYEATVDTTRTDVADMVKAMQQATSPNRRSSSASSAAWSPDWTEYHIDEVDLHRVTCPPSTWRQPYTSTGVLSHARNSPGVLRPRRSSRWHPFMPSPPRTPPVGSSSPTPTPDVVPPGRVQPAPSPATACLGARLHERQPPPTNVPGGRHEAQGTDRQDPSDIAISSPGATASPSSSDAALGRHHRRRQGRRAPRRQDGARCRDRRPRRPSRGPRGRTGRGRAATRLQSQVAVAEQPARTPTTEIRVGSSLAPTVGTPTVAPPVLPRRVALVPRHRPAATRRLAPHGRGQVERGSALDAMSTRAAGTGAFARLVVPQYLTDLVAPGEGEPPVRGRVQPRPAPQGMTVNLSRITTGTSSDLQSAENVAVSGTDIDDTLLSISVQTNAGQQTLSRQAVERNGRRGRHARGPVQGSRPRLDATLLNQATNGLTNVATSVRVHRRHSDHPSSCTRRCWRPSPASRAPCSTRTRRQRRRDAQPAVVLDAEQRRVVLARRAATGIAPQMIAANYAEAYGSGTAACSPAAPR